MSHVNHSLTKERITEMLDGSERSATLLKKALAVVLTMEQSSVDVPLRFLERFSSNKLRGTVLVMYQFYYQGFAVELCYSKLHKLAIIDALCGNLLDYICDTPQEAIVRYVFQKESC